MASPKNACQPFSVQYLIVKSAIILKVVIAIE